MDQQEMTRFLLLSPEINQEKIFAGIHQSSRKESDKKKYYKELNENPLRKALIKRIQAIKAEGIDEIIIENEKLVQDRFLAHIKNPQPRNQRDIKRIYSIIKSVTLLNVWHRKREGSTVYASEFDIDTGLKSGTRYHSFKSLKYLRIFMSSTSKSFCLYGIGTR